MKIQEIMSRNVKTAGPDDDARSVSKKFEDLKIHHIPVVERGKVVGILSMNDYRGVMRVGEKGATVTPDMVFGGLTVRSLMTENPITVTPEDTVENAATLILQHDIHSLPVVEKGALVGIVTENDILRAVAKGQLSG